MTVTAERKYYEGLYEIAAKVNSAGTPAAVLRYLVRKVATIMGAKGCSIMLLSPDRKHLLHTIAYGLSDAYIRKGPVSVDKSLSEALSGKPVAAVNAAEDERIQYREQARREGIASILSVPIKLRDETIGVIRIYTAEPYEFTEGDIYFVSAAANLGAIALENARIYRALEQEYETFRREMLEWRSALGEEWAEGKAVSAFSE